MECCGETGRDICGKAVMKKKIILIIILIAIVPIIWSITTRNRPSRALDIPEYNYTPDLEAASYVEVEVANQPILPDTLEHIEPWVEQTVSASGSWIPDTIYTPEDTLKVEVSGIEMKDGSRWIRVEIEGKPVHIERADWFIKEEEPGRWSGGLEAAVLHGFDIGAYGAYRLGTVLKIHAEIAVVVDVNTDLSESPDWIAGEFRLSIPLGGSIEGGGGFGGMATRDEIDFYASIGGGIRF